jgi:hypothetical protein
MSKEIGFSSIIFSHLPCFLAKKLSPHAISQSGCTDLLENVFSIDLCKQNFKKVVDERSLGILSEIT